MKHLVMTLTIVLASLVVSKADDVAKILAGDETVITAEEVDLRLSAGQFALRGSTEIVEEAPDVALKFCECGEKNPQMIVVAETVGRTCLDEGLFLFRRIRRIEEPVKLSEHVYEGTTLKRLDAFKYLSGAALLITSGQLTGCDKLRQIVKNNEKRD